MNMANCKKQTSVKKTGRSKPLMAKAGVTGTHRRYGCGGKLKK